MTLSNLQHLDASWVSEHAKAESWRASPLAQLVQDKLKQQGKAFDASESLKSLKQQTRVIEATSLQELKEQLEALFGNGAVQIKPADLGITPEFELFKKHNEPVNWDLAQAVRKDVDCVSITVPAHFQLEEALWLSLNLPAKAQVALDWHLGEHAKLTLVEDLRCLEEGLVQLSTHITLEKQATLQHLRLGGKVQEKSTSLSFVKVLVKEEARYEMFVVATAFAYQRHSVQMALLGKNAHGHCYALNLLAKDCFADYETLIIHEHFETYSDELVKSVLADKSRTNVQGKIFVQRDAQRIIGNQLLQGLGLSNQAQFYVKPQLEIYADDVQCSHGATFGDFDLDQVFYLRSRGLSDSVARTLLLDAFVHEVFDEANWLTEVCLEAILKIKEVWLSQTHIDFS